MTHRVTRLALAGLTVGFLLGVGAPTVAIAQSEETEEPSCDDLKKQIADKKREKRKAEADLKKKQKAYDKAVKANKKYAAWWKANGHKVDKEQERAKDREKRQELLAAFRAARDALGAAKEALAKIDKDLADLEAKLEAQCDEETAAYVPDTTEESTTDEVDPWYAWMAWYDEELDTFPDCEAELFEYDMYDLETGDLCEE